MAVIIGTTPNETLTGSGSADTITALEGDGNESLIGLGGNDSLVGHGGNDTLDGGIGIDTMVGGTGDDTYVVDVVGDITNETLNGGGYDTVLISPAAAGTYVLRAGIERGRITPTIAGLHLTGNELHNELIGGAGSNSLSGLAGNDWLDGGAGVDTLLGGDGNDNLRGGAGNDSIAGGNDWDWVTYDDATGPATVNLTTNRGSAANLGTDTLSGIESVRGSPHADTLTGDGADNHFDGGAGNDSISGGGGRDSVGYWNATGPVVVDLEDGTVSGADGNDLLSSIEDVRGSNHGDTIIGSSADNYIEPRGGSDSVDGGSGYDTLGFWDATGPVNASLLSGRAFIGADTDTLAGIEALVGYDFNDTLIGDDDDNGLSGGGGNDSLVGNGGNDFLGGDDGHDTLLGGDGDDNLQGGDGNDSISGGSGTDFIVGGRGVDSIDGGGNNDVALFEDAVQPVAINLLTNTVSDDGHGNAETISNVENLHGGGFGDTLTLGNGGTYAFGRAGGDTITGGGGNDNLIGGSGADSLTGGSGNDNADYYDGGFDGGGAITQGASVNLVTNRAVDGWGFTDTLAGVENASGTQLADTMVGNASANSFSGNEGNDSLAGGGGNDNLFGHQGNDTLLGEAGADFLMGGAGNDLIDGGTVTDLVNYSDGNTISYDDAEDGIVMDLRGYSSDGNGGSGTVQDGFGHVDTVMRIGFVTGSRHDDSIRGSDATWFEMFDGGLGNDTLDGGLNGSNRIRYNTATSGVVVDLLAGTASGGGGDDVLSNFQAAYGSNHDDTIYGTHTTAYFEQFSGNAGSDRIDGRGGIDVVRLEQGGSNAITANLVTGIANDGQGGTDTLVGIEGVYGGTGNDSLLGGNPASDAFETWRGGAGNDTIDGGSGIDRAEYGNSTAAVNITLANSGDTTVSDGLGGSDTLRNVEGLLGTAFNDTLTGNNSANTLEGGNGNDTLRGGLGNDSLSGGGGTDWIYYDTASGPVTVNLVAATVSGAAGNDSVSGVERVLGSPFADTMTGNSNLNNEMFEGGAGNDVLDGGAITDRSGYVNGNWASYSRSTGAVSVDLSGITGDGSGSGTASDGLGGTDTLTNIPWIQGSPQNDSILGTLSTLFEQHEGGAGDDTIDGGNDPIGADELGGTRAVYTNAPSAVTVDLSAGTATGGDGSDTLRHVQQVGGSAHDDSMLGSSGKDQFVGNAGNDTIDGGAGEDWVRFDNATTGVSFTLNATGAEQTVADGQGGTDTVRNVEHVRTGSGADSLTGSARTDIVEVFYPRAGNDTVNGGAGVDRVLYVDSPVGVNVTIAGGGSAGGSDGYGNTDTLVNIEQVRGSRFNDTLSGSDGAALESFDGRHGNDTIDGNGGPDQADHFYAWVGGAHVDLQAGAATQDGYGGSDTLLDIEHARGAQDYGDTLLGSAGANSLDGAGGNDLLDGRAGNDTLLGGEGNDTLIGGSGTDSLVGGLGNDRYEIDALTEAVADDGGTDTVAVNVASGTYTMPAIIENAQVLGTGAVNITGNTGNNQINGGAGNNSLSGGDGNDTLWADAGNDTVDGGAGDDLLQLPNPLSLYALTEVGASEIRLTSGEGENILLRSNVENVQFFDGTRSFATLLALAGGAGAESIEGDDGPNLLDGAGGNDTLVGKGGNDTLIGGTGIDSLVGGPGDDQYRVDVAADIVVELADQGTDSVQVSFAGTHTLAPNVENATATGAATVITHLVGNERPNLLSGNAAANSLTGNAGNDTLDGGLGNDTMAGGPGDDRYVLSAPTDVVNETAAGSDGIDTELLVFTAAGSDTLDGGVEHAVVGNALAVNVTGNALNNALTGGDGANSLAGLAGDDWLIGHGGNDTLAGGPGFDTADYSAAGSGVSVNLATGSASGGAGSDQLSEVEKLIGTAFNDTLTGSPADETFVPGAGDDLVTGGGAAMFDTVDYSAANGPLLINLKTQSASGGGIGNDTLVGVRQLIGSAFADSVTGSDGGGDEDTEIVIGGAGNDTIQGGTTEILVRYLQGPVTANLALGTASSPTEGTDTLVNAGVWGSPQADSLVGSDLRDDVLFGDAGNDTVRGGAGDDVLLPGAGSDSMDGGSGDDKVDFFLDTAAVNANLGLGLATSGGDTDTLSGFEHMAGTAFGDTLTGNDGANRVHAESGNDLVQGLGGIDTLVGQLGNDTLDGGAGNDQLFGDEGDDSLLGGAGTDEMHGNAGNDTLRGDDDNDSLFGQEGNDSLVGGNGNDQLRGDAGNDTIVGEAGNDYITGGTGNDSLVGGDGIDTADYFFSDTNGPITVNLGAATPTASGAQGLDTLFGIEYINAGDFNDTITGDANANQVEGRGGNDSILGGGGNDILLGGSGNDTLRGEGGSDFMRGNAGNDSMDGGAVTDRFNYTDGNSLSWSDATASVVVNLSGLSGDGSAGSANAQDGLGGTDTFVNFQFFTLSPQADSYVGSATTQFEQVEPGLGNDTLDGGAFFDPRLERDGNRINFTSAPGAVEVDLEDGTATGGAGTDTFVNFNQVRGSAHNDTLRGSDREDYSESFEGRAGNDSIDGRGGFDIVRYDPATGPVTVNLVSGSAADGQSGTDTLEGIEGVYGGAFNDSLVGGNAAGGTDDTDHTVFELFRGGAGNDTIDGGQGFDIADYMSSVAGVVVTLNDTADGSASDGTSTVPGASGTDVLKDIEGARGSAFNDSLVGSDTAALEGFDGRAGNDTIDGNGGTDIVTYRQSPAGVNVNLLLGTASDGFGGSDTLRDIEWVRGSHLGNDTLTGSTAANTLEGFEGNDSLAGGDGDDRLEPGTGNDIVDGGTGSDTLVVLGDFADYTRQLPSAGDTLLINPATGEQITLRNVETVAFADGDKTLAEVRTGGASPLADTLIGDSGDNLLDGLAGNDRIEGRSGEDTLIGGTGIDTLLGEEGDDEYRIDVATDQVIEDAGEGDDTVLVGFAAAAVYTLPANVEHASVTTAPAVGLVGNAENNRLTGNAVGNALTGGAGNDTLDGGPGNDTLAGGAGDDVYRLNVPTDVVNETAAGSDGIDRVELGFAASATYTLGAGVEDGRVVNSTAVNLVGNAAANRLDGGTGNDTLNGADGDDRLTGGPGNDSLQGGAGFDLAAYDTASGAVMVDLQAGTASGADGNDVLSGIEQVEGGSGNDTLIGNDADNFLTGGGGNDSLVGNGGSDSFSDLLGDNTLDGGAGNDFLGVGAGGNDLLIGGDGHDQAYWDYAPGPVQINLLTGRTTGAAGTDTLVGIEGGRASPFNDTLIGDDNNNEWQGGEGADSIVGGGGIDLVRFTIEQGSVTADLTLGRAFTPTGTDTLSGVENLRGTSFPDTLIGNDGPNWLRGGSTGNAVDGADSLVGGGGDDTLAGEGWTDTLVGGSGNDRYEVYGGEPVVELAGGGTDTLVLVTTHFAAIATLAENVENGIILNGTAAFTLKLIGNGGANVLTGSPFGESITGGDGDDTIAGGGGNDTLDGGNHSSNSFDFVDYRGAAGPVVVNLVHLGVGTATGEGSDTLTNIEAAFGSAFNDSFTLGAGHQLTFVQPGAGNDTITGNGSFDILDYGASPNPILFVPSGLKSGTATGDGSDSFSGIEGLFGSAHNDTITGSDGNETIRPRAGNDLAHGGGGIDRIDYRNASGSVVVSLLTNTSSGADGNDTLSGFENVRGSLNSGDTLAGDDASNLVDGLGGNDSLVGNGGDDTFVGGAGNDTLVGGSHFFWDTVDYTGAGSGVNVNLGAGTASGDGSDQLQGIEGVWGSVHNDTLVGITAEYNLFWPNLGNDTITGGTSFAILGYDGQDLPVTVVFTGPGAGTATGLGTDVFTGIDLVVGSNSADSLVGHDGDDAFAGGPGNDTLIGGAGIDSAQYLFAPAGVNVSLLSNLSSGGAGVDTLSGFENLQGSLNFGDTLTGDGGSNFLIGYGGNDSLAGGAGNDTLQAGSGVDIADGGADSDTLQLEAAFAAYTLSRPNANDIVLVNAATGENVTARNIENLQFSDGTRTLASLLAVTPSAFNDTLEGTGGNDSIDALAGNDSVSGFGGDDTLVGGTGNDTLLGGPGNDVYGVDSALDQVVEDPLAGTDTVLLTLPAAGTYVLPANVEAAVAPTGNLAVHLTGNELDNSLQGNAAVNTLVGGLGNDVLNGGAGADVMRGGADDDLYFVDLATDVVDETSVGSSGTDRVQMLFTAAGSYTLPAGVEMGFAGGGAGLALGLTGNAQDNQLVGHDGSNNLSGGDGNDTLDGQGGNDTVDGGVGAADLLLLPGAGSDYAITRPSATQTLFTASSRSLLVSNVELVRFGADTPVALADLIATLGSPGNDTLTGGADDDSINGGAGNDTLAGGGGTDILDGGIGSDSYTILPGAELDVIEQNDTVAGSVDAVVLPAGVLPADVSITRGHYSFNDLVVRLPDGGQVVVVDFFAGEAINPGTIDQLRFANGSVLTQAQLAAAANSFVGGEQVFVGTVGNDTMSGDKLGSADDWINGGSGNDTLAGLTGQDTLFGAAGNDSIAGALGSDWLSGGDGADTIDGGAGEDLLAGGAGSDRYLFGLTSEIDIIDESMQLPGWVDAQVSGAGPVYAPTDGDAPRSTDTDIVVLGAGITTSNLVPTRIDDDLLLAVDGSNAMLQVVGYFAPGVPTIDRFLFANGSAWTATNIRIRVLVPTEDDDTLIGYLGGDNLRGLGGDDELDGREGNDILTGGEGADMLTGGSGADRFVFTDGTAPVAVDLVTDFVPGVDTLVMSAAGFTSLAGLVGQRIDPDLNAFVAYDPNTGALRYDADGEGVGAAGIVIAVLGVATHPGALGLDILVGS